MRDCEERDGSGWRILLAEDGRGRGDLRCPECRQPVHYHKKRSDGGRAHFEHNRVPFLPTARARTCQGYNSPNFGGRDGRDILISHKMPDIRLSEKSRIGEIRRTRPDFPRGSTQEFHDELIVRDFRARTFGQNRRR
jgi:hypothetical protein